MLIGVLAGALGAALLAEAWLVCLLRRAGAWARPVEAESLDAVLPGDVRPSAALRARVARELGPSGEQGIAQCLAALAWLVAQFPVDDAAEGGGAAVRCSDPELFPHARRPHCGEIAALYCETLSALGIENRRVWLRKNIFDPHDSHVSVEARVDGRWVLIDPTFHATFAEADADGGASDGGRLLGAQDIKARIFPGGREMIRPAVHGRALCPLALADYYVDVLSCFNNVFVLEAPPRPALCKLPPMCFGMGPKLHFEKLADESVAHLRVWRQLYCAAAFALPVIIVVLGLAVVIAAWV